jgi:hypothetical protein
VAGTCGKNAKEAGPDVKRIVKEQSPTKDEITDLRKV